MGGLMNIGWIDFSKSDRDMVMKVLRQLTDEGAMDELGIGTIRDAFSDILFPGTSTIQRRAKYLFLIPYICLELERDSKLSPYEFRKSLEQQELDLISTLREGNAYGVIGVRSRQDLRRKPSSIYWNALRTYGFFTERLTLSQYVESFCLKRDAAKNQKMSGKRKLRDEDDTIDDSDTGMTGTTFWRVPVYKKDWRSKVTIDLTADEATYLREKILAMPGTRDSLLALVLRKNRREFTAFKNFEDIASLREIMPVEMWRDYLLARDFSRFIHGAQIRYNVIFSGGQNEEANNLWNDYAQARPPINLTEIQARLKPRPGVMAFLKQFQSALDNTKILDKLIMQREKDLKGPVRAKLTNKELYTYDGKSININPLSYRLSNAQIIVSDIFEGVGRNA